MLGKPKKGRDTMRKKYTRASIEVEGEKYEPGKGMEDGFILWSKVITNGWVSSEGLVKITQADGQVMCPFIQNRRGMVFIREGDYIVYEEGGERHCCGSDKFSNRYHEIE